MKLVILDRDGVINYDSPDFIKSPEEWRAIPGSLEAIRKLNHAKIKVALATNQSGIARGLYDINMLNLIHQKMQTELAKLGAHIDDIFFCPHAPETNCDCRKPKIGLFTQIAEKYKLNFKETVVPAIGDSLRDLESAKTAGCYPILVLTGNGAKTKQAITTTALQNTPIYQDLAAAVDALLLKGMPL